MRPIRLPEPARGLWTATRDAIADALRGQPHAIGGGTVLAAQWQHRVSFDVDLRLEENSRLQGLEGDSRFQRRLRELGATGTYHQRLNLYTIRFGSGSDERAVQLWGRDLGLRAGQARRLVEGQDTQSRSTRMATTTLGTVRQTYKDYCATPDDERYELLDGNLMMVPAPNRKHQKVLLRFAHKLETSPKNTSWARCTSHHSTWFCPTPTSCSPTCCSSRERASTR